MTQGGDPSLAQFAELMLAQFQLAYPEAGFEHSEDERSIRGGEGGPRIFLGNLHTAYLAADAEEREELVQRIVRMGGNVDADDVPPLDEVRGSLLPKVWTRYHLEFPALEFSAAEESPEIEMVTVPRWKLGDHLIAVLVRDEEERVTGVMSDALDAWGESAEVLCDEAEMRTEDLVESWQVMESPSGGKGRLIVPEVDPTYAASALFCTSSFQRLGLAEGALASVPTKSTLYILEPGDAQLEDAFIAGIESADQEGSHPLCPVPLEWRGGRWQPWAVPAEHPFGARYRNMERVFTYSLYEEQKGILDRVHDARDEDVFVSSQMLHEVEGQDDYVSTVAWSRGVEALLCKADRVAFIELNLTPEVSITVGWEKVVDIVGHLLEEVPGMHPVRYRVSEYPSVEELKALG